ncbi:MAG: type II CAAX endopeptidase family protein [Bacteroidota bacterium]|nr:type II CAAX endopeptidase family protein [Bacteroidota bacterium]
MKNPIYGQQSPFIQMLIFLLVVIISLLFTMLLGILLAVPFYGTDILSSMNAMNDLSNPSSLALLKYFQIVNQTGLFLIPSFFFAWLVSTGVSRYLGFNVKPYLLSIVVGSAAMLFSLPFIGWLADVNQQMNLPDSLSGLENWMKNSEEQARVLTEVFLSTTSIGGLAINMLMIAIIPAVGEEIFFRGILQRLFNQMTRNVHAAVIISALLFSALHMQFYGFLPRFALGLILGYLFAWSGSIWVPIIVHFINNGFAVMAMFLASHNMVETDLDSLGTTNSQPLVIISVMLVMLLMGVVYYWEKKKQEERIL